MNCDGEHQLEYVYLNNEDLDHTSKIDFIHATITILPTVYICFFDRHGLPLDHIPNIVMTFHVKPHNRLLHVRLCNNLGKWYITLLPVR